MKNSKISLRHLIQLCDQSRTLLACLSQFVLTIAVHVCIVTRVKRGSFMIVESGVISLDPRVSLQITSQAHDRLVQCSQISS